jgi:hypothetical protein
MGRLACTSIRLAVTALAPYAARGQSEIDPDHFDSPNTEPLSPGTDAEHSIPSVGYRGAFVLPFPVWCNGTNLPPGNYVISLTSNGETGRFVLTRKGKNIGVSAVAQKHAYRHSNDALFVEKKRSIRVLSRIQVASWFFILTSNPNSDRIKASTFESIEELPLTLTDVNGVRKSRR